MTYSYPPRVRLANLPTPVRHLARLGQSFGNPELYVKRDDLTGIGLTGNKVRKLEFLVADARDRGAQVLITCGAVQSNHARATAIAAAKVGMNCHLVLRMSNSRTFDGNLFLDRLVDAEIKFISEAEYESVDEIMAELAQEYAERGQKAYVIPEGGSNALGAVGYIAAVEELKQQLGQAGLKIDAVVAAVGSGGTHAGLLLGSRIHGLQAEIIGINVCDDAPSFVNRIYDLTRSWNKQFAGEPKLSRSDVKIVDGYVGKGYGLSRREELDTIKTAARLEGLLLDPVYTGKAMYAIKDLIQKGLLAPPKRILFVHTGGIYGLFPKKNLFF